MANERWASRLGVILVVASGAIGLGNFLRFPGQAVKNGGGAFMIPYILSFILLGIPVCLSEWIMGRMGGKYGHSSPFVFRPFLSGTPLRLTGAIAIMIPLLIYVYYVFIEAWCLSYAFDFLSGNINLHPAGAVQGTQEYTDLVVKNAGIHFNNLVGATGNGASIKSNILHYTIICFLLNFFIVYLGIVRGLETLAKLAVPVMLVSAVIILIRVLTLDRISEGLGRMWNPDWSSLLNAGVWIAAAGQIFFSLSVGFGIVLIFASYLNEKDDVTLSGLSAASLNEFVEVAFGGLITIPVGFIFLGIAVTSFGTFGMGFIALPAVFALMPAGQFFGAIWFFILFIAALTSSVTMVQPGIAFLEEGFGLSRRKSILILSIFTFALNFGIMYYNKGFGALDYADFWVGTILIYILATIQVVLYGWKLGPLAGRLEGEKGSLFEIPRSFDFIIKYITPFFLIAIFVVFAFQNLPEYLGKMSIEITLSKSPGESIESIQESVYVARGVFAGIIGSFLLIYILVHLSLRRKGV